jgi:hypothetical protein
LGDATKKRTFANPCFTTPNLRNNLADAAKKNPPDCALSAEADIYACPLGCAEKFSDGTICRRHHFEVGETMRNHSFL